MIIMEKEKLEKALKSIGKKSFIEDYEVYSNQQLPPTKRTEILSEKYSSAGAAIRFSFADDIFQNSKQKEALTGCLLINTLETIPENLLKI